MSAKKKVVIVGGGFGGVKSALNLARHKGFSVTLISDRPDFFFYPTLYHTATGGSSSVSQIPLIDIVGGRAVNLLIDKAEKINKKDRKIKLESGETIHFDVLILALGSITNYFNIPGLKEYSYGIKSIEEAEELKQHLHAQITDKREPDLNYIVIGGGPTGIELAAALPDYVRKILKQHGLPKHKVNVELVEAMPRLLPKLPKTVSRSLAKRLRKLGVKLYLNTPVQAETANDLLMGGKYIRSRSVIWTAGVANNPFFADNHFQLNKNGKVIVDKLLQAWPGVYVIGDSADTEFSGMAQTALHDAEFVTNNLIRHHNDKKPYAYKIKQPVYVLPVGKGWAAVKWGRFEFYGRVGWWLRRVADWRAYSEIEPWWRATEHILDTFDTEDDCVACAQHEAN